MATHIKLFLRRDGRSYRFSVINPFSECTWGSEGSDWREIMRTLRCCRELGHMVCAVTYFRENLYAVKLNKSFICAVKLIGSNMSVVT